MSSTIRAAGREFLYVSVGALLGLLWCVVLISGLAAGIGASVALVGFPLLAVVLLVWRWAANTERDRAALVLGAPIRRPERPSTSGGLLARWRARATDRATLKELAYLLLLGPVGIASGAIVLGLWAGVAAALAAPALASAAPAGSLLGRLDTAELAAVLAGGVVLAAITIVLTHLVALACAAFADGLLAPDDRAVLAARVDRLETTRAGAVESADARLRRVERDLHDGAQHRLAYIAMELDRARSKLASDPQAADALLGRAHAESKRAMVELRELVRGIHPSVLTDRGLDAAVSGLAERCPIPVEVVVRLDRRPPSGVETAAYYVVAEALTNVARHAQAHRAAVEIHTDDESLRLVVEVRDDGSGALRTPGSGLEGLGQRIEALDGSLVIESPTGGPTSLRAELPCAS
ncbi:MAG TPA: sensor domain-containing protein [Solirubrobacteraceae bacterium]|nr:sensor domain-containing protein [Solirubrobacteraceae bacterium]